MNFSVTEIVWWLCLAPAGKRFGIAYWRDAEGDGEDSGVLANTK
jgi:hypothetical protein